MNTVKSMEKIPYDNPEQMKIWLAMYLERNDSDVDSLKELVDRVYADAFKKGEDKGYSLGGLREGSMLFSSNYERY